MKTSKIDPKLHRCPSCQTDHVSGATPWLQAASVQPLRHEVAECERWQRDVIAGCRLLADEHRADGEELRRMRTEIAEQARLLAMGSEREAALLGERDRLLRKVAALTALAARRESEAPHRLFPDHDGMPPSCIYYERFDTPPGSQGPIAYRVYAQSDNIYVEANGVCVRVTVRDPGVAIDYGSSPRYTTDPVALVPTGFQQIEIIPMGAADEAAE